MPTDTVEYRRWDEPEFIAYDLNLFSHWFENGNPVDLGSIEDFLADHLCDAGSDLQELRLTRDSEVVFDKTYTWPDR